MTYIMGDIMDSVYILYNCKARRNFIQLCKGDGILNKGSKQGYQQEYWLQTGPVHGEGHLPLHG